MLALMKLDILIYTGIHAVDFHTLIFVWYENILCVFLDIRASAEFHAKLASELLFKCMQTSELYCLDMHM